MKPRRIILACTIAAVVSVPIGLRPAGGAGPAPIPDSAAPGPDAIASLAGQSVMTIQFVMMTVPVGTVSQSKDFWKRIDESPRVVDVASYDVLSKNGIRVGLGSAGDWPYFKKLLDPSGVTVDHDAPILIPPGSRHPLDIEASDPLLEQTLMWFDRDGALQGRSYDECRNLFAMSFMPEPRMSQTLRVELCPVVRATRKHYSYTVENGEKEARFENKEQLFDVNLRADVPPGSFLIVAPSTEATNTMGIGYHFLTCDGTASRSERVMIFSTAQVTPPAKRKLAATRPVASQATRQK